MKIIIAGGTGFIGQALTQRWLAQEHQITVLGRDKAKVKALFADKVTAIDWQEFETQQTPLLKDCDAIINLCGANIGAKRWSQQRRQEILDSRIKPTKTIATACAQLQTDSPRLFNASAVSYYGLAANTDNGLPTAHDEEEEKIKPSNDFLSTIAHAWEKACQPAVDADIPLTNLRFAVVLAKHGGALPQMALPFYFGMGGRIGSGKQSFAWISLHDLCRAFDFLLQHPELKGPINLVAPKCIKQIELAHALGRAMHRPSLIPMPAWLLTTIFGDMAKELLLSGQHVVPTRLLDAGFTFDHADIDTALQAIY